MNNLNYQIRKWADYYVLLKLQKVYKWFCLFIVNESEKILNFLGPIKKDVNYKQEKLGESDRCSIWIFHTDYLLLLTFCIKRKKNQKTTVLRVNGGIHLLVLFFLSFLDLFSSCSYNRDCARFRLFGSWERYLLHIVQCRGKSITVCILEQNRRWVDTWNNLYLEYNQ